MNKLIASDYDKTFHRNDEQDLKNNLRAVEKWRKDGNVFVISTGRDAASILHEKKVRGVDYDYIISLNGSFIVAMLSQRFGDELIISNGFDGCNLTNKKASATDPVAREVFERNAKIYSNDIEASLNNEVLLLGCLNDNLKKAKQLKEEILSRYADQVEVFINLNYINVVPKGISKASGLDLLIEHCQIDEKNVAVIGDDLNDIPMLERHNGYAVNNAKQEVKDISLAVYNSVADLIEDKL